ncbi:SLAP domain-containing protein [Fictibacillus barbaricus]|uniref:SLAP domain-containing protein n=1 Tax=Fictibacillus barbaricus TaxID=182136 RepID=A0ABU1U358_9BACL|nr:SLAP domain-containing protein [Fictibacillus barbaricus]MDR7073929.1 SLAP domain-containing protein [Fictibacillus barbaricus]
MQKLAFEQAWDKTIADQDRLEIQRVFSEMNHENKKGQDAFLLKTAFNHKLQFLVTVLVNNYSNESFSLLNQKAVYVESGKVIAKLESEYTLEIPSQTSMPWTFIFSEDQLEQDPSGYSGELKFI